MHTFRSPMKMTLEIDGKRRAVLFSRYDMNYLAWPVVLT